MQGWSLPWSLRWGCVGSRRCCGAVVLPPLLLPLLLLSATKRMGGVRVGWWGRGWRRRQRKKQRMRRRMRRPFTRRVARIRLYCLIMQIVRLPDKWGRFYRHCVVWCGRSCYVSSQDKGRTHPMLSPPPSLPPPPSRPPPFSFLLSSS